MGEPGYVRQEMESSLWDLGEEEGGGHVEWRRGEAYTWCNGKAD